MVSPLGKLSPVSRRVGIREAVDVTLANRFSAAWQQFQNSPVAALRLARDRIGRGLSTLISLDRFEVFVFTRAMTLQVDARPELEFRTLACADFEQMRQRNDRFGEQARLYYEQRGISTAFGVFIDGELGHISWVYTAEDYRREPYERFRLGGGEAEIVNCFTAEAYRGKGLYPHAIRMIAERQFLRGFDRVFMNIEPGNEASCRGILKAGLARYGRVLHLRAPAIPKWRGCYWRQHKVDPVFKAAV